MERLVIISDKDRAGLRSWLEAGIRRRSDFKDVFLSRAKTSRIRGEIVPMGPDAVLVTASLRNEMESRELKGFLRKLREHLPKALIVVHSPQISDAQREEMIEAGADGWISDMADELALSQALKRMVATKEASTP